MKFLAAATFALTLTMAGSAGAATITGLYNTGVDAGGAATTGNGADLHWSLNGGEAYTGAQNGMFPLGPWLAETATSRWLTPTPNAADSFDPSVAGEYSYSLAFDLPTFSAASFFASFAADNVVSLITLNGNVLTPTTGGGFGGWDSFSASTGDFVAGTNVLTVKVANFAQNGGNPTGFRLEFGQSDVAPVPEPATWAMMIMGFGAMGALMRSNRRRLQTA
ncbi:MAG: PEPxxWA-CTERM sorting domain-containing protein [Alphaproteobacteria bacterium]|nr:PEPxxWA-CTERM sorting domain-containing protein [Alphaproteobacteria bacterium]MBU1512853.1 PEPxxWA-CTERM sorting domain-containing protein [Alphaproteobacteria bacterium]MBU2096706.1 PEPxxWA-CTERM sorting domain-containing protein [Alphaproteobacteria bacterium]MBU2150589.1 PEPxxWA-CTERM sorting domain-containing protein [Alphaproteobacteria bacterium]MBU2308087.1 PEPxxWA-CTERM sorting domain-containing protein [Alphaproteobacteria bacterium]